MSSTDSSTASIGVRADARDMSCGCTEFCVAAALTALSSEQATPAAPQATSKDYERPMSVTRAPLFPPPKRTPA